VQAARFFGALANGGLYLRCPSEMSLGAACQSTRIFPEDVDISPILAGMSEVMKSGTGARLAKLTGIRVYGKTGTADAPGQKDEKIYGIKPGSMGSPHSWFAAIAEPAETTTACGESPAGRYVVVAVVPHGGFGASVAGPLVMDTLKDMQSLGFFP
jgi:penicillin-binding protein 2